MVNSTKIVNIFPNFTRIVLKNNAYFMIFRSYFVFSSPPDYTTFISLFACAHLRFSHIWIKSEKSPISHPSIFRSFCPLLAFWFFNLFSYFCPYSSVCSFQLLTFFFLQHFFILNFIVPNSFRMVLQCFSLSALQTNFSNLILSSYLFRLVFFRSI